MLLIVPCSMFAARFNAAMLYQQQRRRMGEWRTFRAHPPPSQGSSANSVRLRRQHQQAGSSIRCYPILVQFQGASVDIQPGAVTVSTSKGIAATARCEGLTRVRYVDKLMSPDVDGTVLLRPGRVSPSAMEE
jgi:hypothetical protein